MTKKINRRDFIKTSTVIGLGALAGWAVARSVAWNCDVADGYLIIQKPPSFSKPVRCCFKINIVNISYFI